MLTVLIHINIEVDTDDDEEAVRLGYAYLQRHNVPLEDIADVEAV